MARPRKLSDKQEATIKCMQDNRINDGIILRNIIDAKLQWAIAEYKKGEEVITKQLQQVKENQTTLLKLSAVISTLKELLEFKQDKSQNPDENENIEK